MFQAILSLFKAARKSLSFAISVLTLLWFYPDIRDLPDAYGFKWGQIMPDRETVAFVLLGISISWIVWIDVRPTIIRWWRSRKDPPLKIEFPDEINHIGEYGTNKRTHYYVNKDGVGKSFSRSTYYLDLTNTTGKTIKNVTAHVHAVNNGGGWFPERKLRTAQGGIKVDIQPEFTEYFLIGFCDNEDGAGEHVQIISGSDFRRISDEYTHYGKKGGIGFMMILEKLKIPFLKNNGAGFELGIYADDLPPSRHLFVMDCKDQFEIFYDGPLGPDEHPVSDAQMGRLKMRRTPTRYRFEDSEPPPPKDIEEKTQPKTRPD